jgi:hypothetical protein
MEITVTDMENDPYTDWADVVREQARSDAEQGHGDYALKMLLARGFGTEVSG